MTPAEIVTACRDAGVTLAVEDGRLMATSRGAMDPTLVAELRAHKSEVLAHLSGAASAGGLGSPVSIREAVAAVQSGAVARVWSEACADTLRLCRDDEARAGLLADGVEPWRVWTLAEVRQVASRGPEYVRNVHRLRVEMGATLTDSDDRRICRDCAEYAEPHCRAALRGELPATGRDYLPDADRLHRCAGYRAREVAA